jgi:hypothetical protein
MQGFGLHVVPDPFQVPPAAVQASAVMPATQAVPKQQAPVGGGGGGGLPQSGQKSHSSDQWDTPSPIRTHPVVTLWAHSPWSRMGLAAVQLAVVSLRERMHVELAGVVGMDQEQQPQALPP